MACEPNERPCAEVGPFRYCPVKGCDWTEDVSPSPLAQIEALHQRVQEPAPMTYGEIYHVHCSCEYQNVVYMWSPGDPEPAWQCPTRRVIDAAKDRN